MKEDDEKEGDQGNHQSNRNELEDLLNNDDDDDLKRKNSPTSRLKLVRGFPAELLFGTHLESTMTSCCEALLLSYINKAA